MIAVNGRVVAQGSQFSLSDVEVVSATIDIEDVRAHRAKSSRSMQAAAAERYHRVEVDFALTSGKFEEVREEDLIGLIGSKTLDVRYHTPEEEIASVVYFIIVHTGRLTGYRLGPACWLWDYLRRSRTQGYFIPLSGGIDSCATAVIVYSMCRLVADAARRGGQYPNLHRNLVIADSICNPEEQVIADARRISGEPEDSDYIPSDPREFASRIFHTCYMGTENSSVETRRRAKQLAEAIGRYVQYSLLHAFSLADLTLHQLSH